MSKPVVIITDVTGFLGSHVCYAFLIDGGYQVKGIVDSSEKEEVLEAIKKSYQGKFDELELVKVDMNDSEALL